MLRLAFFASLAFLAACTQFPELDETVDPSVTDAPYPDLKPQDDLLTDANATQIDEEMTREELAQRSADLAARAAALNASVLQEF